MSYVHVLSEGPTRIRSTVMRGDEVEMSVTIAGRWDIVGDNWEARLYGRGRYWSMGVSRSIATVDGTDEDWIYGSGYVGFALSEQVPSFMGNDGGSFRLSTNSGTKQLLSNGLLIFEPATVTAVLASYAMEA